MVLTEPCSFEGYDLSSNIKGSVSNSSSSNIPDHTPQDCKAVREAHGFHGKY